MKRLTRLASLLVAFSTIILAGACASGPTFGSSRVQGPIEPKFYDGDLILPNPQEIKDVLYRTYYQRFNGGVLQVTAIPQTKPLVNSKIHAHIKDEAFKNKLSPEEELKALNAELDKAQKQRAKETCFSIKAEASDVDAAETKYWYGKVITDGGETLPISFTKFTGFTETTRYAETSEYTNTISTYDVDKHFLYSIACTAKPFDLTKDFSVEIEPRYKRGIKPVLLRWGKPRPLPQDLINFR